MARLLARRTTEELRFGGSAEGTETEKKPNGGGGLGNRWGRKKKKERTQRENSAPSAGLNVFFFDHLELGEIFFFAFEPLSHVSFLRTFSFKRAAEHAPLSSQAPWERKLSSLTLSTFMSSILVVQK